MKKFLFGVAFLIVGAGIAVGALMLTGRLADSTTPTSHTRTTSGRVVTTYSPTPTRGPSFTTITYTTPTFTVTTLDAALAALCIDLQDRARAAVDALNYGDDEGRAEAIRAVGDLNSHCPFRYRSVSVPPAQPPPILP